MYLYSVINIKTILKQLFEKNNNEFISKSEIKEIN